eukprot:6188856-Pleurochrysis_carterae.AAC.1
MASTDIFPAKTTEQPLSPQMQACESPAIVLHAAPERAVRPGARFAVTSCSLSLVAGASAVALAANTLRSCDCTQPVPCSKQRRGSARINSSSPEGMRP